MGKARGFFKGVQKISEGVKDFFRAIEIWRGLRLFLGGRGLFSVVETFSRGEFFSCRL